MTPDYGLPTTDRGAWAPQRDVPALVFALVFPAVMSCLYLIVFGSSVEAPAQASWPMQLAFFIGKGVQFSFPAVYVWVFERERLRLVLPTLRGLEFGFGFGLVVALAMLGLFFGGLGENRAFEHTPDKVHRLVQDMGLATHNRFVLLAAFFCVSHSLLEEYYWRWFVFGWLRRYLPPGAAIALSAVGFTAHHLILLLVYFPGRFWTLAVPLSACVAIGGAVWAWLYHRTDSLYAAWISHALVDVAIYVIGYTMLRRFWE